MLSIILVEDDKKKIEDISSYLKEILTDYKLTVKESYQSGLREIMKGTFDILLLDMSIPTWDKSISSSSGEFQKFGGYTILKEMNRKGKMIPSLLISMFDEFGESDRSITLKQLNNILKDEFTDYYLGAIYYSSSHNEWKSNLESKLMTYLK